MKRFISFSIILLIFAFSCTNKDRSVDTESILTPLVGTYYFANLEGDQIVVIEDCQTLMPDQLIIEKSNDKFLFFFNSFHNESYLVLSEINTPEFIEVRAMDENLLDDREAMDESKATLFFIKLKENIIRITTSGSEYNVILKESTPQYIYQSCQEFDDEPHEDESSESSNVQHDYGPILPEDKELVKEIVQELFSFVDTTQLYTNPFVDEHFLVVLSRLGSFTTSTGNPQRDRSKKNNQAAFPGLFSSHAICMAKTKSILL